MCCHRQFQLIRRITENIFNQRVPGGERERESNAKDSTACERLIKQSTGKGGCSTNSHRTCARPRGTSISSTMIEAVLVTAWMKTSADKEEEKTRGKNEEWGGGKINRPGASKNIINPRNVSHCNWLCVKRLSAARKLLKNGFNNVSQTSEEPFFFYL